MNRRQMLKSLALCGGVAATGLPKLVKAKSKTVSAVNYKALFEKALKDNPKLIGYSGVEHDLMSENLVIEGRLPMDLRGHFYRNGPARLERGEIRYQHLFEGDGMVHDFTIAKGKIHHRGKFIQTNKYKAEQAAEEFLFSGPDTRLQNSLAITKADDINVANTSILPVGGDLWALWEAGSATRLDRSSLNYRGQVKLGEQTAAGSSLAGMPFSAHPKVMPEGDIWNFGYNSTGHIIIYHLNSQGRLLNFKVVNTQFTGGMLHDFLVTQNHVLLILPSIKQNGGNQGYFAQLGFAPEQPLEVLVLDKTHMAVQRRYELDPAFVFHFGNAWEDNQGNIRMDASLYPHLDVLHKLSDLMAGELPKEETNAQPTLITLYKNGKVDTQAFKIVSEFPRVLPQTTGHKNQHLYFLSSGQNAVWHDTICQLNVDNGKLNQFQFGDDFIVEEHVPFSPSGKENKAYLIGTALHVPTKRSCLNVFDANALQNGPVCRAWLPYYLPLGFHGHFQQA